MSLVQICCAVLVPLIWGLQFVVIKVALAAFSPLFLLSLRFVIVAALLLPFVARPTRAQLWPLVLVSVFMGGLNFSLAFVGLALGSAGGAAVAIQLSTPFALVLAWPLLRERPTLLLVTGVVIALFGVGLTAGDPLHSASLMPTLLVTGSAFSLAMGSVLVKRYGPFPSMMLLGWMSAITVPQVLVMSYALENGQMDSLHTASLSAWLALLYTVVLGGIAGFGLWFWLIKTCSMSRVAPFGLLQTLFGVVSSMLFLDEHMTVRLAAGMLVSIAGVGLTQVKGVTGGSPRARARG